MDAQTIQGGDRKQAQARVDKTLPPRPFPGQEDPGQQPQGPGTPPQDGSRGIDPYEPKSPLDTNEPGTTEVIPGDPSLTPLATPLEEKTPEEKARIASSLDDAKAAATELGLEGREFAEFVLRKLGPLGLEESNVSNGSNGYKVPATDYHKEHQNTIRAGRYYEEMAGIEGSDSSEEQEVFMRKKMGDEQYELYQKLRNDGPPRGGIGDEGPYTKPYEPGRDLMGEKGVYQHEPFFEGQKAEGPDGQGGFIYKLPDNMVEEYQKNNQNESRNDETLEEGITKREDGSYEFNGRRIIRSQNDTTVPPETELKKKQDAYRERRNKPSDYEKAQAKRKKEYEERKKNAKNKRKRRTS